MPPVTLEFDIGTLLESNPNHLQGRPYIRGTRVAVQKVGILYSEGADAAEIAERMTLELPSVHAALCFYLMHRAAIDEDIQEQDDEYFRLAEEHEAVATREPPCAVLR